jgi:hypothetical protein
MRARISARRYPVDGDHAAHGPMDANLQSAGLCTREFLLSRHAEDLVSWRKGKYLDREQRFAVCLLDPPAGRNLPIRYRPQNCRNLW